MSATLIPHVVPRTAQGTRPYQEDSIWPLPSFQAQLDNGDWLLVVADGAGGHRGGDVASRSAVEVILREYQQAARTLVPPDALRHAIVAANQTVRTLRQRHPDKESMATTVVALVKRGNAIWVANVGDSRAYVYRTGTPFVQITEDHTVINAQVKLGNLDAERAKHHPLRNRLAHALGSHDEIPVLDIFPLTDVRAGDRYLLCSDGLTNGLSETELATFLAGAPPLDALADQMLAQAVVRAQDNVSLILMELAPASAAPTTLPLALTDHARKQSNDGIPGMLPYVLVLLLLVMIGMLLVVLRLVSSGPEGRGLLLAPPSTVASGTPPTVGVLSTPSLAVAPSRTPFLSVRPQVLLAASPTSYRPSRGTPIYQVRVSETLIVFDFGASAPACLSHLRNPPTLVDARSIVTPHITAAGDNLQIAIDTGGPHAAEVCGPFAERVIRDEATGAWTILDAAQVQMETWEGSDRLLVYVQWR